MFQMFRYIFLCRFLLFFRFLFFLINNYFHTKNNSSILSASIFQFHLLLLESNIIANLVYLNLKNLLSYFLIFLNGRFTNFFYSITNFIILLINYFLLFKNSESRILIPLTMIGFIIFILNIFKTTKKLSAIN